MNRRLETLFERISAWPDEAQAELVDSILAIESKHLGVYRLTDDERVAVRRGLEEMRTGKFATDEEVAALFER